MMFSCIVFLVAATLGQPTNATAIVFIETKNIGVPSIGQMAPHNEWIVWPNPNAAGLTSQLASLRFSNYADFNRRSISFRNRNSSTFQVSTVKSPIPMEESDCRILRIDETRAISPALLLLATDPSTMLTSIDTLPKTHPEILYFAEVRSWEEVAKIKDEITGRILVIESPKTSANRWTRMWRYGDWPKGITTDGVIAGLVHSNSISTLIERAPLAMFPLLKSLKTHPNEVLRLGTVGPQIKIVMLAFFAIIAILLQYLLGEEKHAWINISWLVVFVAFVTSTIWIGSVISNFGTEGWVITWLVLFFFLSLLGLILMQLSQKRREFSCLRFMILCFAITGLSNGHYSPLSPTVALENRVFDIQFALLAVTMIYSLRGSMYLDGILWMAPRILALGFILHGALGNPAWAQGGKDAVLCLLGLWLYAEGLSGWPVMIALILSPFQIDRLLIGTDHEWSTITSLIITAIFIVIQTITFGKNHKFFVHQMSKANVSILRKNLLFFGLILVPPLWGAILPALIFSQVIRRLIAAESLQNLDLQRKSI